MALRNKAEYELPAQIQALGTLIAKNEIVEEMEHVLNNQCEFVCIGHEVTLIDAQGEKRIITILGYGESNPKRQIVSYLTPLGEALLDLELGDEVTLPWQGQQTNYEIIEIRLSPLLDLT